MKIYIDQGVNQTEIKKLRKQFDIVLINASSIEKYIKGSIEVGKPFRLNVSYLDSDDFLVGPAYNTITAIIGKDNQKDIDHLYTAYAHQCDYFVTDNPKDFIREIRNDPISSEKRDKLESVLNGLKIVTIEEFNKNLKRTHL